MQWINLILKLILLWTLKAKCPKPVTTAHFNCSFLLSLALKPNTRVMMLLVPTRSKFNPNMIEILVLYRLPMGSWSGIGTCTIFILSNINVERWELFPIGTERWAHPFQNWEMDHESEMKGIAVGVMCMCKSEILLALSVDRDYASTSQFQE